MAELRDVYDAAVFGHCAGWMGEGLPLPPLPLPPYHPVESGSWHFRMIMLAACPGYFRGPQSMQGQPVATLTRDGVTWMSTTPAEIESQMPHVAASHGRVVICGLGLGVMAYAVAARRNVTSVVVVERDPEVVALFQRCSGFAEWPQRHKIEIQIMDAKAFQCSDVDFLYADIWPRYRMAEMLPDMQAMYANCPAPGCGYWGQELDMVDWAQTQGIRTENFDDTCADNFCKNCNLPLIGTALPRYADLCRRATRQYLCGLMPPGHPPVSKSSCPPGTGGCRIL